MKEVQKVREQLNNTVSSIAAHVDTLSDEIKLQSSNISDDI